MWNRKNGAWKKLLRSILFITVLALLIGAVSFTLEGKSAKARLSLFFSQETSYDAMYFGTSHVINGFLPQELWEEFGITSYNFGGNGMNLPATYWLIRNVLDYTKPKLIFIDCSKLSSDIMSNTTIQQAHGIWDAFPLTKNKWLAVKDIFEPEERLEFLWKLSIYHNRWNELTKDDFGVTYSVNHGAIPYFTVAVPKKFVPISDESKSPENTNGVIYLRKAIELCQSQGIEVVLTYLPFPASATKQKEANLAADIAKEYGIPYLNFLKMENIVDFHTDLKDADHLNFSGACKITSYLGQYLTDNFHFSSHKEDKAYEQWDKDYLQYAQTTTNRFSWQKTLDSNLLLLSNKKYSSCIYIREGSALFNDTRILGLINNICAGKNLEKLNLAAEKGEEYFLFADNLNETFFECIGDDTGSSQSFPAPIHYGTEPDGSHALSIGNAKYLLEDNTPADIQIAIIDNTNGSIIKTMSFRVSVSESKLTATRGDYLQNVNASPTEGND